MNKLTIIGLVLVLFIACDREYTPLPHGELRIALPAHSYTVVDSGCPYNFEIPTYSRVVRRKAPENNCWSDLVMPHQGAKIHMSYRKVQDDLPRILNETHELTFGHHQMADNIEDERILRPDADVYGTVYTISGNVASNVQFYVTDSAEHFLRGSLYFNTAPNKDSLAPVVDHLKDDILHLMQSLSWID